MLHRLFRICFVVLHNLCKHQSLTKAIQEAYRNLAPIGVKALHKPYQSPYFRTTPTRFHVLTQPLQESILYTSQHKSRLKNPCQKNKKTRHPILNYNVSIRETSYDWYIYTLLMNIQKLHLHEIFDLQFCFSKESTWSPDPYPKFVLNIKLIAQRS